MRLSRWLGIAYGAIGVTALCLLCVGLALDSESLKTWGKFVLLAAVIVGITPLIGFLLVRAYERFRMRL